MNDHKTVPGQLDEIMARLERGNVRMNQADVARAEMNSKLDSTMAKLDTLALCMEKNTEITETVRDALTTARIGRKVFIWLAGLAGAGWTAYQSFIHK
jgi:hypothetical protein